MAVDTPTYFAQVIQDHLDLKRRNAELEGDMPLERYMHEDPFENHPLFKTEEQARIEDTLDGEPAVTAEGRVVDWVGEDTVEHAFAEEEAEPGEPGEPGEPAESLWGRSREFDWGD